MITNAYPNFGLANITRGATVDSNGTLYVAYLANDGTYQIATEDHGPVVIANSADPSDIHYHVSIVIDPKGYIHAFFDGHNSTGRHCRSTQPRNIADWTTPQEFHGNTTYSLPFMRGNRLCVVHRSNNTQSLTCTYTDTPLAPVWSHHEIVRLSTPRAYPQEIDDDGGLVFSRTTEPELNLHRKLGYCRTIDGVDWRDQSGNRVDKDVAPWAIPWPHNDITCARGLARAKDRDVVIAEYRDPTQSKTNTFYPALPAVA